jgi:hypothetical protein
LPDAAAAVAVHALEGVEGAVVGALDLGAEAEVDAEFRFLFLGQRFGDAGLASIVMATDVLPEFAVDAANAAEFPGGLGKLLDQKVFVHVGGLVGFVEAAAELSEFLLILTGEQAGFVLCHKRSSRLHYYHGVEIDSEIRICRSLITKRK